MSSRSDSSVEDKVEEGIRKLIKGDLYEWSPVLVGMNPATQLLNTKGLGEKPYPNEHACRLRSPEDFEAGSFRRVKREHEGKEYSVIMGRLKGAETLTEQAYRYPKGVWSEDSAKAHCSGHDGSFEAAAKGQTFIDQTEMALAAIAEVKNRAGSLADLREKEGRTLSEANRKRLESLVGMLKEVADDIQSLLDETAKPEKAASISRRRALLLRADLVAHNLSAE